MKWLFAISALFALAAAVLGQSGGWWVSTDLGNLALRQANVRAHIARGRWDFGARLDYRPAWGKGQVGGGAGSSYEASNFRNWNYQAIGLGPVARMNFGTARRIFLEADAFYRLWWLNRRWMTYDNVESYSFSGLRTERQHVAALRVLWGGRGGSLRMGRSSALAIEGFGGIGARWKRLRFITHEGELLRFDPARMCAPCIEDCAYWTPTIHLGVRLAFLSTREAQHP